MVMGRNGLGRNGHGPKWLWAEMTRNRSPGLGAGADLLFLVYINDLPDEVRSHMKIDR